MTFRGSVILLCTCVLFAGCGKQRREALSIPEVVTADIQAAIERHIDEQVRAGGGYFRFSSGGKHFSFKLVRVHTEYLANLGPRRHFACVDLADSSGDVYDVDFFLAGDPGAMTVTETTLHKLNGQPFYVWEQKWNKTWKRVPIKGAPPELQGIITGEDEFEFKYFATLPTITNSARMWLPYPSSDQFQDVQATIVTSPGEHLVLEDQEHGNRILFFELGREDSGKTIDIRYKVRRSEKAAYAGSTNTAKYLLAERLVPDDEAFRAIAAEVIINKKGDLVRARALYDHVIERMSYIKNGEGWGKGDAVYACDARTGNCTDFHSYFIALARAINIPARFAIGTALPSSRDEGGISGYHCWAEFFAEGKWWPVDISEADKYSSQSTYYFGHNPANRLEFSRGRDLVVDPAPVSGPINFLAYPLVELDGVPIKVPVTFSFKRTPDKRRT